MKDYIWYEKYRPSKIGALALPDEHMESFNRFIEDKEIPHLLFHGPRGTGKTSVAKILMDHCGGSKLTLNASSRDRGVATIKEKVYNFARNKNPSKKKNIVFLDEADGLTPDAQMALKNTVEAMHKNCRFIFTANNVGKIIPEIQSRCIIFRFDQLPKKNLLKICQRILQKESIEHKRKDLRALIKEYYPDARSIINHLQCGSVDGKEFDLSKASSSLSHINKKLLADHIEKGRIFSIRTMWSGMRDFTWLYQWLFNYYMKEKCDKAEMISVAIEIADYMHKDTNVADREINATACLIRIMLITNTEINFDEPF